MNRVMKDSGIEWFGEIPEEWDICRIKRVASIVTGNTPSKANGQANYSDDGLMWIKPDDLSETVSIKDTTEHLSEEGRQTARIVTAYTPLVCCIGTIGKVGYTDNETSFNQQINAICFNESVNKRFGLYLLISQEEQQKCYANGNVIKILNSESQGRLFVAIPPIYEQQLIADYLDKRCSIIDGLVAEKEKINELLKEWRQSIIYEVVTKGFDSSVPMKDSGIEWIGKIPASWSTAPLRSKFSFGKGLTITKSDLADDGFCVISYGQIHSKDNVGVCVNASLVKYISKSHKSLVNSAKTNVGDFIFADTSEDIQGCGNNVYIDRDDCIYAGYHTLILRSKNSRQNKYYAYLFSSDAWRAQVRARVSGVKLYSITQGILKSTTLIVPPSSEQDRIIEYLDAKCNKIDLAITQNNVTIQQLKEYRQSLIYEAVTGKICINEMEKK